jgi:pimeloyl-ACP methyl ester carboxylesterase
MSKVNMSQPSPHPVAYLPGIVWTYPITEELHLRGREYLRHSNRPLIHFMHGNGFSAMTYWPLLSKLHETYDLCLHDAQGHGDSDDGVAFPGWNVTAERMATVVQHRRKQWGKRPIIGMGHSFGGVITLLAAAHYPQLFDALILLDPVIFPRFLGWLMAVGEFTGLSRYTPMASRARRRTARWSSYEEAWDYFYQRGIFRGWSEEALEAYIRFALLTHPDGSLSLKCPPWMEAAIFQSRPHGLWKAIADLQVPTHIIYGKNTYPFIEPSVQAAVQGNKMITAQSILGGHCFMQQDPQLTKIRIVEHLQHHAMV